MLKRLIHAPSIILVMAALLLLCQCKRTDYSLKTKWVYINDTDSSIYFSPAMVTFNLDPKDTLVIEDISDGSKESSVSSLVPPLRPYIIYYGTTHCDTVGSPANGPNEGEGPQGIANYEVQKIKNNDFVCTFRFTDSMLQKATLCK